MRRLGVVVALAAAFACADGFGLGGRLQLNIVPVFTGSVFEILSGDLTALHIRITRVERPSAAAAAVVFDETVPVDADGNVDIDVKVPLNAATDTFAVLLEGIRESDKLVLYSGADTVTVTAGRGASVATVPVTYVGPCQLGAGCRIAVAPQDTFVSQGGSFIMRVAVDSAQVAVAGVPIEFTNLSPTLVAVTPDRRVTALVSTVGGPARVVAAIRGAVDTLRLTVAQGVAVSPGHATLRTIAPGNTIQLSGGIGGVTWLSRSPAVATVSSTGLVTATGRGTATIVASSGGVGDSIVVAVGNPALPGDAVALALGGGRTFGMARVGQPIAVDVLVDPAAVPVELLGSYNARFIWNTAVMRFDSTQVGTFAAPTLNTDSTSIGVVRFAAVDPIGSIGVQTLVRLWFTGMTPGTSGQALQITEMSAAQTFTDFLRTNHVIVASGNVTIKP